MHERVNAFLRSVSVYGRIVCSQDHGPDQCFPAMQPTMRQHSQPLLATDIGPGLQNLLMPQAAKPSNTAWSPLCIRGQSTKPIFHAAYCMNRSVHEGFGGCSARLWGVQWQPLGVAVPGFGGCSGRLWDVHWQACCGQVTRTSGCRVAL